MLVVVPGLILVAYVFLGVVAQVWTVMIVKLFPIVSAENWFNHVGRTCCFSFSVFCFKGFKDLFQEFQRLFLLWFQSQWMLVVFVSCVKNSYNLFQNKSYSVGGVLFLKVI